VQKLIKLFTATLVFLTFAILITPLLTTPTHAAQLRTTPETYNVTADEIINDDLYIIEDDTTTTGTSTIEIAGTINGDLAIAGGNIIVSGYVTGNLWVAGGNVEISGNIEKSAYVAGGNVSITGYVGRDLYIATGMIDFTGTVEEDLVVFAGQGAVAGIVGDDLRISAGNITVTSVIGGDLITMAGTAVSDSATVTGETIVKTSETGGLDLPDEIVVERESTLERMAGSFFEQLLSALGIFIVGLVFIKFMPVKSYAIAKKISGSFEDFIKDLAIGFVVIFMLPIVIILLLISSIGAPLAILLGGLAFFITLFGSIWFDIVVGTNILKLLKVDHNSYGAFSTGIALRFITGLIPVINFIYWFLTVSVVTGAVIRVKMDSVKACKAGKSVGSTEKIVQPKVKNIAKKAVKATKKTAKTK